MSVTETDRNREASPFEDAPGLRRAKTLCSALGNPEKSLRVIHVAGTNGKGSVCRYLYETLRALGHTVGIFTSPYVVDLPERIEVDGEMITAQQLETLMSRVSTAAKALAKEGANEDNADDGPPTEFEIITTAGFLYFAERSPDFIVLEAGLGGRNDATNVIKEPLVSVITKVALDHTDRLGNTIEEIAWEKAGIIKKGCPVVTGASQAAAALIANVADEKGAPLIEASKIRYNITRRSLSGCTFDTSIENRRYRGIELAMAGEHQVENAMTALCVLDLLHARGIIRIDDEALRRGLKAARLGARFQIISKDPLVIVDGAHNPDGARALIRTLHGFFPNGRLLFVCSFLKDKAAQDILKIFAQITTAFIATGSDYERTLDAATLGEMMRTEGCTVLYEAASPKEAYEAAMRMAAEYDAVVFAGSLYTAGDIIRVAAQANGSA
jgi:dihydrofolate synthase/folylpolyglutamate synthase